MGVWRVTITGSLFGQKIQNVLHFQKFQSVDSDAWTLVNKLNDAWLTQIRNLCTQSMHWTEIMAQDAQDEDKVPTILPVNWFGGWTTGTNIFLPCSLVYQIKTSVAGRRGRGRFYIAGVEPNGITNGRWGTGMRQQFTSVATSLKSNFVGSNASSPFRLGVMRRGGGEADFITATDLVARDYPGSQVRRNFNRGQ